MFDVVVAAATRIHFIPTTFIRKYNTPLNSHHPYHILSTLSEATKRQSVERPGSQMFVRLVAKTDRQTDSGTFLVCISIDLFSFYLCDCVYAALYTFTCRYVDVTRCTSVVLG